MENEEIAHDEQFLLFPQCFLLNQKIVSPLVNIYDIISLFAAELEEPKISMWRKGLTLSQTSPGFLRVCSTNLLKTLWEEEKLLVMSNFSFSHSVFCPIRKLSTIFINFEIVVCKLFQFGRAQNLSFGKGLRCQNHEKNFGYYKEIFHKYLCQISNQSQIFLHLAFYTTFSSYIMETPNLSVCFIGFIRLRLGLCSVCSKDISMEAKCA